MSFDIKEFLKKSWFVILVGICFVSIAIYFAWDTNKDTIGAKSSKGKDVIFSLADKNYTADEYYKTLFDKTSEGSTIPTGVQLVYTKLEREVINQSVKTTDKMQKEVDEMIKSGEANWKQQNGSNFKETIGAELVKMGYEGYDDLERYFLDTKKAVAFFIDYYKANPEVYADIVTNDSPRAVSHILVKVDTKDSSTDEEKAAAEATAQTRMAEIDGLLEKGKFEEVAASNSDDTSKSSGGSLGIQTNKDSLDEAFKTAAWSLESGQVSGWVRSQYGYHKIKIDSTDIEKMLKDDKYSDSFIKMVSTSKPLLRKETVWAKAKELKMEIKDKDLEKQLTDFISKEK